MKIFAIVFFFVLSSACIAGEPDSWFKDWPSGADGKSIPADHVIEVPHSLFEYAETLLRERPYLRLEDGNLSGFYTCPSNTRAYLLRALYEHPTTGMFDVERTEKNDLLVRHYALGPHVAVHRSALVVCLDFVPNRIYIGTGGAM